MGLHPLFDPDAAIELTRLETPMSYIHEALKKAQREKDLLVGKGGKVWSAHRYQSRVFRREWLVPVGLVLIAVAFLSHSWSDSVTQQPSPNEARVVVRQPAQKPSGDVHAQKAPGSDLEPLSPKPRPEKPLAAEEKTNRALAALAEAKKKEQEVQKAVPKQPDPDKGAALYSQAVALQKEGRLKEGKELYEAALEHSPQLVSALNNLGAIYIQEQNYPAASKAFEKAIRIKPGYVDPYYNLACLHALQNDVGRSLFYLKKAISIDKDVGKWASTDKDLQNLHGHSEYEKIIQAPQQES